MAKRNKRVLIPAALLALALLLTAACDNRLILRQYTVETGKVSGPVRLVVLTDLHSCAYGVGQRELLAAVGGTPVPECFTVLMAHRPEQIDSYLSYPFDLIVSGHAHGGQWRIPGLLNGLYAPNQGLFPKYAGGRYDLEDTTFLVGRGLARESTRIPRLFNRPELVVVDIVPQ